MKRNEVGWDGSKCQRDNRRESESERERGREGEREGGRG